MADRLGRDFDDLALLEGHRFKLGTNQVPILKTDLVQKPVANSGACMRF